MKKILRYSFAMLMAVVCSTNAMAEDVIWSEDWTGYNAAANPQGINPAYTFTGSVLNNDGTVKSGTKIYDNNLAGGTAPELLVAKNGGYLAAKVALNGKSGDMVLTFKVNRNDLTVEVEGATLGEKKRTGNDDEYPITVAAGTAEITITFKMTTGSNARLDDIKLYQGTAKKPAGLSWGKASTTATIGADNTLPTLSNENNLPVTFSSSEPTVATISAAGEITLVAAGKTNLTATFDGNDEYEAQSVTIELTVKEATTQEPEAEVEEVSVAKALEIIAALGDGKTTDKEYRVKGYLVTAPDFQRKNDNTLYGNVNFDMADTQGGATVLTVFRAKDFDNKNFTEETINRIKEDDLVVMQGKLQKYVKNDVVTPELTNGYIYSVNGQTSGIAAAKVAAAANRAPLYTISGRRAANNAKGLVVKDGKKLIKK